MLEPRVIRSRAWDDMERFYHQREKTELAELCRSVLVRGYSHRLFGFTSVYDLKTSNHEPLRLGFDLLTISPLPDGGHDFSFSPNLFAPDEFVRSYSPGVLVPKFWSFVEYARW